MGYGQGMDISLTRTAILKELAQVGDKLAEPSLTQKQRMVLLRRQASLVDLREALSERLRRAAP
jgi:hypothetical protein